MKRSVLFVLLLFVSVVFLTSCATTMSVSDAQIYDLRDLGYPIVFEGPFPDDSGGMYMRVRNISNLEIRYVSFLYGDSLLRVADSFMGGPSNWRPNRVVEARWNDENPGREIREIEVHFIRRTWAWSPSTITFNHAQVQRMRARQDYIQGQIAFEIQRAAEEEAEAIRVAQAEREREAAERERIAQAEAARRGSEAEIAFQAALASRNIDTILRFLFNPTYAQASSSSRRSEMVQEGYAEIASQNYYRQQQY